MFSQLSTKIKISALTLPAFVFISLFTLSFAIFTFADNQSSSDKNIFQDADQDGLSDEEEKLYGTDPNKNDTDGDGYTDGAEIKSGYNPLKPAPGDKLITEQEASITDSSSREKTKDSETKNASGINLTEEVSNQVATTFKDKASQNQDLSLDELRSTIQQTLDEKATLGTLPEIDKKTIKIKKQKYAQLSTADRDAKIKEDTLNYVTAIGYILVNNAPVPLHSGDDLEKLSAFTDSQTAGILSGNNMALLDDLSQKGTIILEQLNSMSVPENMVDIHIKALSIMQYATTLQKDFHPNDSSDPLANIAVLVKTQGLMSLFTGLATEISATLKQYGIQEIPI